MRLNRASGVLLHPTSLPSRYGIGELGEQARAFIDFLSESKQQLWQILPLNPPGFGNSPYQAYSAFAGNPLLISIDELAREGLLTEEDISDVPRFTEENIDFTRVREYKNGLFKKAFARFDALPKDQSYHGFVSANFYWLHYYAFFMALKTHFYDMPWNEWEKAVARRWTEVIAYYGHLLAVDIRYHYFLQYKFHGQWMKIKEYANNRGIKIIGDLPIFVSYDSSDTWVHPRLFELDKEGYPAKVAGVPPDYFSETGQLWGNPHYCWDIMAEDDYLWWRERFKKMLECVDYIRVDHFRGFEAYWEVPGDEETAIHGRWVKGPGKPFFALLEKYLGKLPIIAEDLGYITPEVIELRDAFLFPGMKILQFTWQESIDSCSSHKNTVYYTGTHDNDTLLGWYKDVVLAGLRVDPDRIIPEQVCWDYIEAVSQSACRWAVIPLQDILSLDGWARMNHPGTVGSPNWEWRYRKESLTPEIKERLAELTLKHQRYSH